MPDISQKQAVAALNAGMAKGGHAEFTVEIARNPRMFGDVVLFARATTASGPEYAWAGISRCSTASA